MSATEATTKLGNELRRISGSEFVIDDPGKLHEHQVLGIIPGTVVIPGSADEIAAILQMANECGVCVVPAGGFTQQHIGNVPSEVDILLYTSRLTEVEHYDPGDLTVGVGAGCTAAHLSAMVAANELLFAGDPALPQQCTVGGMLATGVYGPLRHGYGSLRDYCIGIRFVTGDGRKAKGGGRVVKNVAGYDMMKLLIGSQGTLGVITSASFKLFPAPRQTRTFIAVFPTSAEALEFRQVVLRSPLDPICLELISPQAHRLLVPTSPATAWWTVALRAAGSDGVLSRYRMELGSAVAHEMEGDKEYGFWQKLADFAPLTREQRPNSVLFSLMLPLRDVQATLANFAVIADAASFAMAAVGHAGVGHLAVALWPGSDQGLTVATYVDTVLALRARVPRDASMATLHCPDEVRSKLNAWGPMPTDIDSMRAVKHALDPNNILNRGRFLF